MATKSPSDYVLYQLLPAKLTEGLKNWIRTSTSVNILITGRTGIGKSTLVNGLVGSKVAKEGETLDPLTTKVEKQSKKISEVVVNVWDSPGLQDLTGKEDLYLADISAKCRGNIDLFIYCINMSEDRFIPGGKEVTAMKKLTGVLGKDLWRNSVVVLTFANSFIGDAGDRCDTVDEIKAEFSSRMEEWRGTVHNVLEKEVELDTEVIQQIKILPAGHYRRPHLFSDGSSSPWLSELWLESIKATKLEAQPALVKVNEHRLKHADKFDERSIKELLFQQPLMFAEMGHKLGARLGIPEIFARQIGAWEGIQSMFCFLGLQNGYFGPNDIQMSSDDEDRTPI